MKQRNKAAVALGLVLAMAANGAPFVGTAAAAAADAPASQSISIDPYTIDWVVKYEEDFTTPVAEPDEWVRDTYEEQKDEFWGDFGYAEQWHYAQDHNGASLEVALSEFGAYRKSYSFGQDDWLTIESYARNAGDDPDTPPEEGGKFIINGDGKAVLVCKKHTDAAIIGSTNPLPSTYRLEVTVGNIDVGGLNQDENGRDVPLSGNWDAWTREEPNPYVDYTGLRRNGYFCNGEYLSAGPWVETDATSQNGMYFLGIVDYGNPRPQNNTFIHYHRKLAFDADNNGHNPWSYVYDENGNKKLDGSRYISMLWLDAYKSNAWTSGCEFYSYTSRGPEHGATMVDKYLPGEEYTFAVIRTPESYTMEVTGNFYYAGQHTYTYTKPHVDENAPAGLSGWTYHFNQTVEELQGMIPPTADDKYDYGNGNVREDWPADSAYPDYFYVGIPHINFYSGTAEFSNITLLVPKGSADDPAMNVKETVSVSGVTVANKTYDGKAMTFDASALNVTRLSDDADLTGTLADQVTYTYYNAADPTRALSITPRDAGSYILKAAVETRLDGELCRGEQVIPFTIGKATLTVTADSKSAQAGSAKPALTCTVSGLAEGDRLVREPVATAGSANMNAAGSYPIMASGAVLAQKVAANYDIVYVPGTLTVTARPTPPTPSRPGGEDIKDPSVPLGETVENEDGSVTVTATDDKGVKTEVTTAKDGGVTARVTLPEDVKRTTVTIPAKDVPAGTVAVIVGEDGTEKIVKKSVVTEDGVAVEVTASVSLKLVDKSVKFDDVKDGSWMDTAVAYVSSRGLFQGMGGGAFAPSAPMTRGMLVTVLARLDGAATEGGETWYEKGVNWAVENSISNGQNPKENITREELAIMLYKYAGKPETKGSLEGFADAGEVRSFASVPLRWAVEQGIIKGEDGRLNPQEPASRAEVAAMLERFVKAIV